MLQVRWLGDNIAYPEAWDLQKALFASSGDYLLLLEHAPVYTLGRNADSANLLVDPAAVGAVAQHVDRGGDITFHGPGQIVGYPIVSVAGKNGGTKPDTSAYIAAIEQLLIEVLAKIGIEADRLDGFPGVWVGTDTEQPRKIAAIGVKIDRGRTMHGFALNAETDLSWFEHIIPCGIRDKAVTTIEAEGVTVERAELIELIVAAAAKHIGNGEPVQRNDVALSVAKTDLSAFTRGHGPGEIIKPTTATKAGTEPATEPQKSQPVSVRLRSRLDQAGVGEGLDLTERKPEWMRVKLKTGEKFRELKKTAKDLDLTTVCEEAGCPNIFDCWNEGTATFMLLGERCTRACGFCLIDTQKPEAVDTEEPQRVAQAVQRLGINFAVLTMVARDDLDDGGAEIVAQTVEAIHTATPDVGVEVLISDLQGNQTSLKTVCDAKPEVFNHNIETVPRLQRAVRPSASYVRSLTVLARAKNYGLTTKSGIIVGMGEKVSEVKLTLTDLAAVGVDIVTVGQYLRPTSNHLPIDRWWEPGEFDELKAYGEDVLGIGHVAASPLTRSSHHAGSIARTV